MASEVCSSARNACLSPNGSYISPNSHPNPNSPHSELFKNKEKSIKELRRRRSETVVELRKQKKDNNIEKRRHVFDDFTFDTQWLDDGEQENILSAQEIIGFIKSWNTIDEIPVKYIKEARRILSSEDTNEMCSQAFVNMLLSDEVMNKLVKSLSNEDASLSSLTELVCLFSQLSSDNNNNVICLLKSGAVINLIDLLSYDNCTVVEKSLLCLANVVSSCVEARDKVLSDGLFARILPLIESEYSISPTKSKYMDDRMHMVRAISWMLFVICQHRDLNSYKYVEYLMPYFIKLLNYDDIDVKAHVLHALSTTTDRDSLQTEALHNSPIISVVELIVNNSSLLATIIDYLSPQNNSVVLYAIRIVANIVSWHVNYAQMVIQTGALLKFDDLVKHQNAHIQKEVAFTLANITAGNCAQIQAVIDANLIPSVVELLYLGDYRTQIESSHIVLNVSSIGNENQALYVMNTDNNIPGMEIFDAMATILTSPDAKVIETALNVYKNLLVFSKKAGYRQIAVKRCESCAAIVHIDSLQHHRNSHISILATNIFEEFFSNDSLAEEDLIFHETINNQVLDKRMEITF